MEAAWSYRYPPRVGRDKQPKVAAAPRRVREIAWNAQTRLCGRFRSLARKGKRPNDRRHGDRPRAVGIHLGDQSRDHGEIGRRNVVPAVARVREVRSPPHSRFAATTVEEGMIVADINRAGVRAGPRQGNSRTPIMWPIVRSTPDVRPGQPQTKKRKCGIQPAHQSLFTDVFASRSLLCTIHRVIQLHASTREDASSRALCSNWDNRTGRPWDDLEKGGFRGRAPGP